MKQKVIFNTVGGQKIEAIVERNSHIEVIDFVDENDYVIVETNGVNQIIPKCMIDSFSVQAVL